MPPLIRALILALVALCCLAGRNSAAMGDEDTDLELSVKAAYLYNFLSYIEWPSRALPAPESPFVIGVAGSEAMVRELRRITAGRTVNRRQVAIKALGPDESLAGIHLLYISHVEPAMQAALLRAAQGLPIVTVTNGDRPPAGESVIHFREVDGRIRFEVSLPAALRCGCRFSARILSVALQVHPAGGR